MTVYALFVCAHLSTGDSCTFMRGPFKTAGECRVVLKGYMHGTIRPDEEGRYWATNRSAYWTCLKRHVEQWH